MKFSIEQKLFSSGIQEVQRAVSSQSKMPILSGILLKVKGDDIVLSATDLEIGIETTLKGDITEEGSLVLPSQHFSSIIRELPPGQITFTMEGHNTVHIECSNSNYDIKGFDPEDFPPLPKVEDGISLKFKQGALKRMIEETKFAASADENQPFLHGALFSVKGNQGEIAATNTYRLACRAFTLEEEIDSDFKVIIPLKTLQELGRLLDSSQEKEVNVTYKDNHLLFSFPPLVVTSRLKEGQFPNYRQVIPHSFNTHCTLPKSDFLQAVRRASFIAREDSNVLEFAFAKGELEIKSRESKIGQAHEVMHMDMEGPEIKTAFTADYLIDVLKVVDKEKVHFSLESAKDPCIVRGLDDETYTYVLMPVNV